MPSSSRVGAHLACLQFGGGGVAQQLLQCAGRAHYVLRAACCLWRVACWALCIQNHRVKEVCPLQPPKGNLETLMTAPAAAGVDVRAAVAGFHAAHYSANLMRLAVYGREVRAAGPWACLLGFPASRCNRSFCVARLESETPATPYAFDLLPSCPGLGAVAKVDPQAVLV
jgi:hypothetical protein